MRKNTMDQENIYNCMIKLRDNPRRYKERVCVGCGAGFGGDRPMGALKLLQRVEQLDYLVLECLAERTLADRYKIKLSGGKGYDPRIKDWMSMLLPLAVERGVCIITNMGAMDPLGAQKEVLQVASNLGLKTTVSVAYEFSPEKTENSLPSERSDDVQGGTSTYLGAIPIVHCLERFKSQVIITSRVADAALFLAPMIYELGWNWNEFELLACGALAGHLLECGCQLTGGYFMHPGDVYRDLSFDQLLDLSLPFAEITYKGKIYLAKAEGSGGLLNFNTCAEQLLYEIGDPACYITPDVIIDIRDVNFQQISEDRVLCQGAKPSFVHFPDKLLQLVPTDCGWKGWGEISYGGSACLSRAQAAEFLVRSWVEELFPGIKDRTLSYIIGHNSLKINTKYHKYPSLNDEITDIRLRMDGLFDREEHAICFIQEFSALYTNGPAGGGGISTGYKKEIILHKKLINRENIFWRTDSKQSNPSNSQTQAIPPIHEIRKPLNTKYPQIAPELAQPAPRGKKIPLYQVAHSRAGDKGNDLNFSLIPHFPNDLHRLKEIITPDWVKITVSPLFDLSILPEEQIVGCKCDLMENVSVEIYDVSGINSLNVVVRNVLDGGVNCSRRIDRHGKTVSDLILCQEIVLP